jgi:MinD-like ATPase involved in chromosome partitioning or flagellar assembly
MTSPPTAVLSGSLSTIHEHQPARSAALVIAPGPHGRLGPDVAPGCPCPRACAAPAHAPALKRFEARFHTGSEEQRAVFPVGESLSQDGASQVHGGPRMSLTPPDRRVITFYSFKGGVGRTMAVANIAYRLANKHGLKVIAVDWDLEAPGLHRFFGLSSEDAAKAHGVLDYFFLWREAVKRQDPEPPSVTEWVLPITDEKHKPRFGSLSLLLAGRLDATYDSRLAAFHWQDFYENDAGAAAVETLREQLVGKADVVLIDSRTGLTDAGGICTIQLPDGVVLMTAPNQQSLEGTERVARSIAKSSAEARAGRERPRMWFVASRVPSVEETFLTERWFATNDPWFNTGIVEGLWLQEGHPEGIQSHQIPYRARWGFDEVVLNEAAKVDPRDALAVPYDRLAETLLRWLRGEPPTVLGATKATSEQPADWRDVEALQNEVTDAERRGDILGMGISPQKLALGLYVSDRYDEAIRRADQASGIFRLFGESRAE